MASVFCVRDLLDLNWTHDHRSLLILRNMKKSTGLRRPDNLWSSVQFNSGIHWQDAEWKKRKKGRLGSRWEWRWGEKGWFDEITTFSNDDLTTLWMKWDWEGGWGCTADVRNPSFYDSKFGSDEWEISHVYSNDVLLLGMRFVLWACFVLSEFFLCVGNGDVSDSRISLKKMTATTAT